MLHARSAGPHAPAHRGGRCRSGTTPGSPPSCRRGPRVRCPSGPCPRPTSWARPELVPGRRGPAPRGRAKSPPAWSPSSPDLIPEKENVAVSSASPAPTKGQQGLGFLCTSQHAQRDSGGLRRATAPHQTQSLRIELAFQQSTKKQTSTSSTHPTPLPNCLPLAAIRPAVPQPCRGPHQTLQSGAANSVQCELQVAQKFR